MDNENIKNENMNEAPDSVVETAAETTTESPVTEPVSAPVAAPAAEPAYVPAAAPAPQANAPYAAPVIQTEQNYPAIPETPKKKSIFKRWWFWVIVGLVSTIAFIAIVSSGDSGSGSSSSGGSSYVPYVSPYVSMVKDATNSTYGIEYGDAFDSFFSDPEWSHFTSTDGQEVVEFEGGFYYDGSPATAKVQFVVDVSEGTFTVYHLSINGVSQNKLMMSALVKKVFESY